MFFKHSQHLDWIQILDIFYRPKILIKIGHQIFFHYNFCFHFAHFCFRLIMKMFFSRERWTFIIHFSSTLIFINFIQSNVLNLYQFSRGKIYNIFVDFCLINFVLTYLHFFFSPITKCHGRNVIHSNFHDVQSLWTSHTVSKI